jgi:hypothetical protein
MTAVSGWEVGSGHPFAVVGEARFCALAYGDTFEEAEQAKRAFELVLAPRFTRDEAIAIVKAAPGFPRHEGEAAKLYLEGMRATLEALAWAGVFSDCGPEQCFSSESCARSMADKLDAAGIK